ncbi:MAG: threonine synthase [Nitrososphaerota archaeon]|nr:threonine synthase [Aigarchaeota archaeon]MDW8076312.1 threonine synthase [Nitrososphaerota archaeon]
MSFKLLCTKCGKQFGSIKNPIRCPSCGGQMLIEYDYDKLSSTINTEEIIKNPLSMWKYSFLLPLTKAEFVVSLGEGGTFLQKAERLGEDLGIKNVYLKNETVNPTGSFLDRGVSVEVTKAKNMGYRVVKCASRGNLGASVAAYSARAGLGCTIYTTLSVELVKLYQAVICGAEISFMKTYDDALKVLTYLYEEEYIISVTSPFFLEGIKTTGYEVCEQLGWSPPEFFIVPVGEGGHLSMIWKALKELSYVGLIDDVHSRMLGVQAKSCSPIVDAFRKNLDKPAKPKDFGMTFHDIAVRQPMLGELCLKALRESKGYALAVSEKKILEATRLLAKFEGIFAEPAAASTIAALKVALEDGIIERSDKVVCVITGAGLKDPAAVKNLIKHPTAETPITLMIASSLDSRLGRTKRLILKILQKHPAHGYLLWKTLMREFGLTITLPSMYQHLKELMEAGLITVVKEGPPSERKKKVYVLTKKGEATLSPELTK